MEHERAIRILLETKVLTLTEGPFRLRLSEVLLRVSRNDPNPTYRPLVVHTASVRVWTRLFLNIVQ